MKQYSPKAPAATDYPDKPAQPFAASVSPAALAAALLAVAIDPAHLGCRRTEGVGQ